MQLGWLRRWWAVLCLAPVVAGCASSGPTGAPGLGYYWQSVTGHVALMNAARPVDDWLADPGVNPALKARLALAQRMRQFAVTDLGLPDNASYTRYADLGRTAVVWNVVATTELSLDLQTWCYPVLGCAGYRGYFKQADAEAFAATLTAQGLEAAVYPVPAYSTLGWMNWLGGDPLLNTFLGHVEGELARLLFHELAHQVVYAQDDTAFNESYATAVERLGGQRWLALHGSEQARAAFEVFDARRQAFRTLTREVRQNLKRIYAPSLDGNASSATHFGSVDVRAAKAAEMARFRARYAELKAAWGGYSGYDAWVARSNNATFALQAAYDQWVPAFETLFEREGQSFARFHAAVADLARLPHADRHAALQRLSRP
ncbi:MAG TPA: aminopeptidase [Burkholderiaceae bacterium]|nr:aminopeptidase [Burkholderiaceae bacterium]